MIGGNVLLGALMIFFTVSVCFSVNIKESVLYLIWLLFNVLIIFFVFSVYVAERGIHKVFDLLRKTLYVQAILIGLQFFIELIFKYQIPFFNSGTYRGIPRPALWFYETSYFSTYFCFWLAASTYLVFVRKIKGYFKDFCCCLISIVLSTATTGYVAIIAVGAFILCYTFIHKDKRFFGLFFGTLFCIAFFAVAMPNIFNTFVLRLFNQNLDVASGGRIQGYAETIKVFFENFFFGTGPNTYGFYLNKGREHVPTNITLELLATTGIFNTIIFYMLIYKLLSGIFKITKYDRSSEAAIAKACAAGLILFIILLQVNQGYMRLYMWMFFGILAGQYYVLKKKKTCVLYARKEKVCVQEVENLS
jgi:O-antigen ligase